MKILATLSLASLAFLVGCAGSDQMAQSTPKPVQTSKQASKTVFVSQYDFDTTVKRIQDGVRQKGMTVFATIDHAQAAQAQNLTMPPATVIVFGTPKAGTPLMNKDLHFALQLPLKALVVQNGTQVEVVMNDTKALIEGSQIAFDDVKDNLHKAVGLVGTLVGAP